MKLIGKHKEQIMKFVFFGVALISVICVALICIFLFWQGLPPMLEIGVDKFITGDVWKPNSEIFGVLPMILGSIYATIGAIIIGAPIGILTAIYLAKFCPRKIYRILHPAVQLMAGIPSIIYGFFGMTVLLPVLNTLFDAKMNGNLLAASIILGIMILPTIISISESAINQVDNSYYEGALALGASHERAVYFAQLRAAKSGIFASAVLGVGRAIGETMAVVMVAGNQAVIPNDLLRGARTLTSNIVIEMGEATDLHRGALLATAVVLFVFILIINLCFSAIREYSNKGGN